MNVEELIEKIRATGVISDDEIKNVLEDAYILALVLEPFEFDVDYKTSNTLTHVPLETKEPKNAHPHNQTLRPRPL